MKAALLFIVPINWAVAVVLHLKTVRRQNVRPRKGELLMYSAIMTIIGSFVGLYVLCRFIITFVFDWSDSHR